MMYFALRDKHLPGRKVVGLLTGLALYFLVAIVTWLAGTEVEYPFK